MATPSDFLKTAEMVWGALDKLSEENPEEYRKFIDQQLKEGSELMTPPQPSYCIACSVHYKGKQVELFLNICKWKKVPPPSSDADPVPVRGGVLRHVVENGNKLSDLLYDVAFNPSVIEECSKHSLLQDMLHSLILDFIADMLNARVDNKSLKSVDSSYKGLATDIQPSLEGNKHLISQESCLDIRESILEELSTVSNSLSDEAKLPPLKIHPEQVEKKNLIEELPDNHHEKKRNKAKNGGKVLKKKDKTKAKKEEDTGAVKCPLYTVDQTEEGLAVTISLPGVSTAAEVDLELSEDDLFMVVKKKYQLKMDFAKLVNEDTVQAKFNTSKNELTINVALKTC